MTGNKRYNKLQKGPIRYKKVQKDTERYRKVQKGTKRYKKVQKYTKRYKIRHCKNNFEKLCQKLGFFEKAIFGNREPLKLW